MLYGLAEVERVELLVADLDANDRAFDMHYAASGTAGGKELVRKRDRILQEMRRGSGTVGKQVDLRSFMDFPGMPNYRKPPVS
jgi:hypothetical protein